MKEKQKLVGRNALAPMDFPQFSSICNHELKEDASPDKHYLANGSQNLEVIEFKTTGGYISRSCIFTLNDNKNGIIRKGEEKMNINIKKVKMARSHKEIRLMIQFLLRQMDLVCSRAVR
ncbi:MAG: hypothetical protein ACYCSO_04010 [Cuniculiplasma sp.]